MDSSKLLNELPSVARNEIADKLATTLTFDKRVKFADNLGSLLGVDDIQTAIGSFYDGKTGGGSYAITGARNVQNLSLVLLYASEGEKELTVGQVLEQLKKAQPSAKDKFDSIFRKVLEQAAPAVDGAAQGGAGASPPASNSSGSKKLRDVGDLEGFLKDELSLWVDSSHFRDIAMELAKEINDGYAKNYQILIKNYIKKHHGVIGGDLKFEENLFGILKWACREPNCPTVDSVRAIIVGVVGDNATEINEAFSSLK